MMIITQYIDQSLKKKKQNASTDHRCNYINTIINQIKSYLVNRRSPSHDDHHNCPSSSMKTR